MDILEERTKYYIDIATKETTLIQRLSGVGLLSHKDAVNLGAVGRPPEPQGRQGRQARRPYAAYADVKFKVITDNHNDVYGRTLVRMGELLECYSIIRQIVKKMPEGPIMVKVPKKIPAVKPSQDTRPREAKTCITSKLTARISLKG